MHADLCLWLVWAFLVLVWLRAAFQLLPAVVFDVCQPVLLLVIAFCLAGGFR